jgi:hypothetical protein
MVSREAYCTKTGPYFDRRCPRQWLVEKVRKGGEEYPDAAARWMHRGLAGLECLGAAARWMHRGLAGLEHSLAGGSAQRRDVEGTAGIRG